MNIVVDNLMIKYEVTGDGPDILLLHGWGSNLKTFDGLAEELSQKYRVIRVDLPGFGESERPRDDWHVEDYVKFVADFLNKLKVKNLFAVVGHSFGGRVVIRGIGTGLIKSNKVILLGAAGIKHSDTVKNTFYKVLAKIGKVVFKIPGLSIFAKTARKKLYRMIGNVDYLQSDHMKNIFLNVINEDLKEYAFKINNPSLLIWGESDAESPFEDAKMFNKLIKNSKLVIIPNSGHFVHIDAHSDVVREIEKFL